MKVKTSELRETASKENGKKELLEQLNQLRTELSGLRTAQVSNGASSKLNKIKGVKKDIARVLTVLNQTSRAEVRKKYEGKSNDQIPKELRVKKTRAMRRRLTKRNTHVPATAQKGGVAKKMVPRMTERQKKKVQNAKKMNYSVLPETESS